MSDDNLLAAAQCMYRYRGVLPMNVAADLMERGFAVDRLEQQWDGRDEVPL